MAYNILILHNLPDFSNTLKSAADYVLCFERYAPEHNYIYHRAVDPFTNALRDIRFDAIIVDATALGLCRARPRETWYREKSRWAFLGESDAVKLVFPQDDYHESAELDAFFDEWDCDRVYTVLPEHADVVYPRMSAKGRLELVLTGYVDDDSIASFEPFARPYDQRSIDIGQRVQFYSPYGGRHAQLKGRLAVAVRDAALAKGLSVDIDTTPEGTLLGSDWLHFLGRMRFVTGAEGGVSVFDPHGAFYDKVYAYLAVNPDASFEEVERVCFFGEDGRHTFSMISPRLFEAAMMGCGQLLVEAPYLGVLEPFEHYIPVKSDFSDVSDAIDLTRDSDAAEKRIEATYEALISSTAFRYSTLVSRVMSDIGEISARRHVRGSPPAEFARLKANHFSEIESLLHGEAPKEPEVSLAPEKSRISLLDRGTRAFRWLYQTKPR